MSFFVTHRLGRRRSLSQRTVWGVAICPEFPRPEKNLSWTEKTGACFSRTDGFRPAIHVPFIPVLRSCRRRKSSGMESKMNRTGMVLGALGSLMLLGGCVSDYRGDGHYRGGYYGNYYSGEPDYYPYAYGPRYVPYNSYHRGYGGGYRDGYRRDQDGYRGGDRGDRRGDRDGDRRGNRDQANANQGDNSGNQSYRRGGHDDGNRGQRSESGGGHGTRDSGSSQQSAPPPSGGPSGRFGHPGTNANPL